MFSMLSFEIAGFLDPSASRVMADFVSLIGDLDAPATLGLLSGEVC